MIKSIAAALLVTATAAFAQDQYNPLPPLPLGDILFSLPTSHIPTDSAFGQLIVSRQFGRRAELFIIPTYATNAGRAVAGTQSQALFKHASNVPIGVAVMVRPALSVVAELIPKNRDLPSGQKADSAWAIGLKRAIGGHYFEILVTNSNATHVDQYVSSTYQGSTLNKSDLHLGFNIERRFGGK